MLLLYGHKKSVESFLVILFPEALVNPLNENKQATPTPNMNCHQTEQSTRDALWRDIHIPKGVYCLLVLGLVRNLPDFRKPKQALINAFYNMSSLFYVGERRCILAYRLHVVNLCEQEILQCFLIRER